MQFYFYSKCKDINALIFGYILNFDFDENKNG